MQSNVYVKSFGIVYRKSVELACLCI